MKERILSTAQGAFVLRQWDGVNRSGLDPLCDKVLVLVDVAQEKTKGGIIIPGSTAEPMSLSSTTGIMVAVGPQAFSWNSDRTARWEGDKPAPGLRVCFQKYAGEEYPGDDGNIYRVMQDRSIGASRGMAEITQA